MHISHHSQSVPTRQAGDYGARLYEFKCLERDILFAKVAQVLRGEVVRIPVGADANSTTDVGA